MKKLITYLILSLSILVISTTASYALAKSASKEIKIGQMYASTDDVGYSISATFYFDTFKDSKAPANANCMCGWRGWPSTNEDYSVVGIGKHWAHQEIQSRSSCYYAKIFSMYMNKTHAKERVTID